MSLERTKRHEFMGIVITLCAVIGGAQGWKEIRRFAVAKRHQCRALNAEGRLLGDRK
jgi:hypothetical protein